MPASVGFRTLFRDAFRVSYPVIFAYFPLGMIFSIIWHQLGFPLYLAPLMCFAVYAGSVQFSAIGIMVAHGSYLSILMATLFIALRNPFYGITVITRFNSAHWFKKTLLFLLLVDANYAIFVSTEPYSNPKDDIQFCWIVSLLVYSYWGFGSVVGAIGAPWLPNIEGIEFVLTVFFAILAFEAYLANRNIVPYLVAAAAATLAALLLPQAFLFAAICLAAILLLVLQPRYGRPVGALEDKSIAPTPALPPNESRVIEDERSITPQDESSPIREDTSSFHEEISSTRDKGQSNSNNSNKDD